VAALGLAWLGLSGASSLLRLVNAVGVEAVWRASRGQLVKWGASERLVADFEEKRRRFDVAQAEAVLGRAGLRFLSLGSQWYPREFLHLALPPAGLFVRATEEALAELAAAPRITVVGTRKSSPEGLRATELFVSALSTRGIVVVSGMALGIDGRAHHSALQTGGLTAAIMGCGADVIYPSRHRWLYEKIAERGVIASELPPGTNPTRWTFPHRNRLLAALGDAVVVIEAPATSGALQTARWALELGRPVFSVPGSILKDGSQGCNMLLYDGAVPALRPEMLVEDFLAQTRIERGTREAHEPTRTTPENGSVTVTSGLGANGRHRAVLDALGEGSTTVDGLLVLTGLPVRELGAALGELEVAGLVARGGPGIYKRAP
jgi:DNA processing protein